MNAMQRYIPGSFIIVVSLAFLIASIMLKQDVLNPASGSFLPALISVIMLLSGVKLIFEGRNTPSSFSAEINESVEEVKEENQEDSDDEDDLPIDTAWQKKDYMLVLAYFGFVVLYVVSLPYLSFFISSFLFLVVSMFFLRGVSLIKNIIISLITVGLLYALFKLLFQIVFP